MDQLLHKLYVNRLEDRMGGKGKGLFVQSFFFPAREKGREFLREQKGNDNGGRANTAVDDILTTGVVIDVNRHAAKGGHFGGELRKAGVVLSKF